MTTRSYVTAGFIALAGLSSAQGQSLLSDAFSGNTLNSLNWIASTPVPGASVAVNNGLVLTNGGSVLTQSGFPTDIQIDMAFKFTGSQYDSFAFVTQTDGTLVPGTVQFADGLVARFRMMSDPSDPAGTNSNVDLYVQTPTGATQLGIGTFSMTQSQTYSVRLTETGSNVSLYINNLSTPFLSGTTTANALGDLIGLNNREGAAAGSGISDGSQVTVESLSVTAIPEPSAYAAVLVLLR